MSEDAGSRRSLFQLIGALPGLIGDLVRAEIDALKAELKAKAIRAGVGAALFAAAAFLVVLALIVFVFAAVAGLATVLPWWASALIVGGGLVVIAIVLMASGVGSFKAMKRVPGRMESIGEDLRTLRGTARQPGEEA